MNPNTKEEGKVTKKRYDKVHRFVDIVVLLLFLLYEIFRSATVQTYLVQHITAYLSKELKTEISIKGVDITGFFHVVLEDLKINDQKHKPVLSIQDLVLGVNRISLTKQTLKFGTVRLVKADIRLVRYAADRNWNYGFLIDYFSSGKAKKPSTSKPWSISVNAVDLRDCRFMMQDQTSDTVSRGICFTNLQFRDINLRVNNLRMEKDSIFGTIRNLSANEKSGLHLKEFRAEIKFSPVMLDAKNLHIVTNRSDVKMDLKFDFHNFSAFNSFLDSVYIHSRIHSSQLNLEDIGFFAPDLMGMDNQLKVEGDFSGNISNLRAKDFRFEFGQNTRFDGNITLSGLPNIKETFVHLSVKELKSSIADLKRIKLPEGNLIPLQLAYDKIGSIGIKGFFTGFYNDFVSYADFKTDAGEFSTDLSVKKGLKPIYISYKGKLKGRNVDIGKLFSEQDMEKLKGKNTSISDFVGRINMDLQVEGKGVDLDNLDAHLVGKLDSLEFKGNKIDNIMLSGAVKQKAFTGIAKIRDALINLDFNGKVDLNKKLPVFDLTARLRDVKLTKLNLIARDTSATLTAHMNLNFTGNNFDNLLGKIALDSTLYSEKGKAIPLKSLVLQTKALSMGDKQVLLRSDYLDGDITGMYSFTRFYSSLNLILNKYLPSLRLWNAVNPTDQFPQNFFYFLTIKNPDKVTSVFLPDLTVTSNSTIKGSFSAPDRNLIINSDATSIVYKGIHYNDFYLKGSTLNNKLFLTSGASRIVFKQDQKSDSASLGIDSVHFQATVAGDSIHYRIKWNDISLVDHNKGDISGFAAFRSLSRINLGITHGQLMLRDSIWTINEHNAISIDSTNIAIESLAFSGKHERLLFQGKISKDPEQKLNMYFQQFDISNWDKFINVHGVDIDGVADGTVSVSNLYHSPNLTTNLNILGLQYNKVKLGDASIHSSWNDQENGVLVDLHVTDASNPSNPEAIVATGSFHPSWETNNFNFNITVKDLQLHALNPFLDSFMSGLNGLASGDLQFLGSTKYPYLKGNVNVKNGTFRIDYLNTKYNFDDKVTFGEKAISFDKFTVRDTLGKTGVVTGEIKNKSFNNWNLNLSIKTNNLLGFNKGHSYNEMYYGVAFGTGDILISGPPENLNFTINANTDKGTNIFIPLNNPGTVSENDFITFVNKADTVDSSAVKAPVAYSGLSMNMTIGVTNAANIQLSLPYDMGHITGKGNGLINMDLNNIGDFTMKGDYTISQGSFVFKLPKYALQREFKILDGSYIRWSGNPYDATINMKGVYQKDVSLSSLPNNATQSSQRIKVDCIISLKDNLFKPKIKFSIALPKDVDETTKRLVFSAIDTTNEAEMNQQMISLLVVGSFSLYNETKSLASSLGAQPYELISNQLNNMLSQISSDFDIGFNYRPGDALTSDEVGLMLSTQLFNDRIKVDFNGNFPTSNNNAGNLQRSSNVVGDADIEIKLTPDGRFMFKAYNKVNRDIIDIYSPYKQGAGISYRKEFDYFRDLFRKKTKTVKPAQ